MTKPRQTQARRVFEERIDRALNGVDGLDLRKIVLDATERSYHAAVDTLVAPELQAAVRGDPELANRWALDGLTVLGRLNELTAAGGEQSRVARAFMGAAFPSDPSQWPAPNPHVSEMDLARWLAPRIQGSDTVRLIVLARPAFVDSDNGDPTLHLFRSLGDGLESRLLEIQADLVRAVREREFRFSDMWLSGLQIETADGPVLVYGRDLYEICYAERTNAAAHRDDETYPQPADEAHAKVMDEITEARRKGRRPRRHFRDRLASLTNDGAFVLAGPDLRVRLRHPDHPATAQLYLLPDEIEEGTADQIHAMLGCRSSLWARVYCGILQQLWKRGEGNEVTLMYDDFMRDALGMSRDQISRNRERVTDLITFFTKLKYSLTQGSAARAAADLNFMTVIGTVWNSVEDKLARRPPAGVRLHFTNLIYGRVRKLKGGPDRLAFIHTSDALPRINHAAYPYVHLLAPALNARLRFEFQRTKVTWIDARGKTLARWAGMPDGQRTWGERGRLQRTLKKLASEKVISSFDWRDGQAPGPDAVCRVHMARKARQILQGLTPAALPPPTGPDVLTGDQLKQWIAATFPSVAKAARTLGIGVSTLERNCKRGEGAVTAKTRRVVAEHRAAHPAPAPAPKK